MSCVPKAKFVRQCVYIVMCESVFYIAFHVAFCEVTESYA